MDPVGGIPHVDTSAGRPESARFPGLNLLEARSSASLRVRDPFSIGIHRTNQEVHDDNPF